jgi:WD40-like Beta Propeller Repeat
MKMLGVLAFAGLLGCAASTGLNGVRPQLWTPASLSSADYEATPTFSVNGNELIYLHANPAFQGWRLKRSVCRDGRWSLPAPPPFAAAGNVIEADPGFTPDGKGLYFISARHDPSNEDFDIYYVARDKRGNWGNPERLPPPVNSPEAELLPRSDLNGNLYFGSARPGGYGQSDIYRAARNVDGVWKVENLGSDINTKANEYEAEVSREGNKLVVVTDRSGRSRLVVYTDSSGHWQETVTVKADEGVFQVGPLISPQGTALLFAQAAGDRSGEIFLVRLSNGSKEEWPPRC